MSIKYEPPPQINDFNHIWRRWIYGFYKNLNNQEAWKPAVFENGWTNVGGDLNDAGYMRDPLGFIHLRGFISSGTVTQAAFTLPAGYRPENREVHITATSGSFGHLSVHSDGQVVINAGSNVWYSIDGISFKAV